MTTALIIGAGIAGPVAAIALQRAGIDAAIYEAQPASADDVGTFLTLQTNGMDALHAIDAYQTVAGVGIPTPVMRFTSGAGRDLGSLSTGGVLPDGTVSHTLRRADLYTALRDEAARRGVPIHHDRRLTHIDQREGRVRATFADGSTADGDLLIGCDGVHSTVRTLIDPTAAAARRIPLLNVGGYADHRVPGAAVGEYHMIFGRRAFFGYVTAPDDITWWFANPPSRTDPGHHAIATTSDAEWRALLRDLFAPDDSPAPDLIDATAHPLRGYQMWDLPTVARWHTDTTVIIGDAAHAASPSSGQGASMAIEDAVQLARCVRDLPTIPAALDAYEHLRRTRVERVVAAGARTTNDKIAGPVARVLRDAFMPLFLRRVANGGRLSLDWIHDHHIDWETPVHAPATTIRSAGHA